MGLIKYPLTKGKKTFELLKSAYKNFYRDDNKKLAYLDKVKANKSKKHKFYNTVGMDGVEYIDEHSYRGSSLYNFFHGETIKREFNPQKIQYLEDLISYYNSNHHLNEGDKILKEELLLKLSLKFENSFSGKYSNETIKEVVNDTILLILLDKFPNTVWGRSLADVAGMYGHAQDPGSITISLWVLDALLNLNPTSFNDLTEQFHNYIINHRKPNGSVGMRKNIGSDYAPKIEIIENNRHTAMAALFLLKIGKAENLALESIINVIHQRTNTWAWSAIRSKEDKDADPLTTSYILHVLKHFDSEGVLSRQNFNESKLFIQKYWESGITWLYQNLLNNSGWWLYSTENNPNHKANSRKYCFTIDILYHLLTHYNNEEFLNDIIEVLFPKLISIWNQNIHGIPIGPNQLPNLVCTAQFSAACWLVRNSYPHYEKMTRKMFFHNLDELLNLNESDCAGWSILIKYLHMISDEIRLNDSEINNLRNKVDFIINLKSEHDVSIDKIVDVFKVNYLKRNINIQLHTLDLIAP